MLHHCRGKLFLWAVNNKITKRIFIALLVALVAIQFIPAQTNTGEATGVNDITSVVPVPADVQQVLNTSCYDCHSNKTVYPWYSRVQPLGLWLNHHVDEGRHELNFTEFATYKIKRQLHKLDEVVETIEEQEMPLSSYTIIHKNAVLSEQQKQLLVSWARQSKLTLQNAQ